MFSKFYFRFVKIVLILHCILYHNICQVINLQRRKQSSAGYFIQHTNRYLDVPEIDRKKSEIRSIVCKNVWKMNDVFQQI